VRVCLDSNVLVSGFATRGLAADVLRLTLTEHELLVPAVVLSEVLRALERKIRLPQDILDAVEESLRKQTVVPKPLSNEGINLRDSADAWVVASAAAANADLLVTGDAEVLALGNYGDMPIVSTRSFWERLTGKAGARP
jgi:putative PIN family toxin of toxin-antitoxin system